MNNYLAKAIICLVLLTSAVSIHAQDVTRVRGTVYDAQTKEVMSFVDVGFVGTNVGVSTDLDGKYLIETRFPSDTLFATFLGYEMAYKVINQEERNKIDFYLKPESIEMEEVTIVVKKGKYKKKNNPAIDLSRKVIENKYINSLKGKDWYSYDQQEKIRLDLNNITEEFKNRPFIRKLDFLWDYVDTSEINGKTYLPSFMRESLSTIHYKKDGNVLKEERHAARYTNVEKTLDPQTVNDLVDALYQDIDVYEEKIDLLDNQFVSPFARAGYDFYRYYILDTTEVNGRSAINLAFIPAVKGNFGFTGNIFISNDGKFTVLKVDMGIINGINLNFVRDMRIVQEFEPQGDAYIKTKDQLVIDYTITDNGIGAFGSRTLYYSNFNFEEPEEKSIFKAFEDVVEKKETNNRSNEYWDNNRLVELEQNDKELYQMVDTLVNDRYFKRYRGVLNAVNTGYIPVGGLNFGPYMTFVSFNQIEGLNLRLGLENRMSLSKKLRVQAYGARAFKADIWKYRGQATYTFNEDWAINPKHYFRLKAERETSFPGQELAFFNPGNFFLSFQRGDVTRMLLTNTYEATYRKELNGRAIQLDLRHRKRLPFGSLEFARGEGYEDLADITTGEVGLSFRYAPNEQFIQGKDVRTQLYNEFPIFNLYYTQGVKGLFDGDYTYSKFQLNIFKQWKWLTKGTTNLIFDAGATIGDDIPYILQNVPRGNQTYVYEQSSYNMMNFMEFNSDKFASVKLAHYWYGYILNRIPLIRKLKLREITTLKVLYGGIERKNNPNIPGNEHLMQYTLGPDGTPLTYNFNSKIPYIEASVGFSNIFKIFRVDLVQRFTYLDHPNVPSLFGQKGMGIRVKTRVEF